MSNVLIYYTLALAFTIIFSSLSFIHFYGTERENLFNNQGLLELVIFSFILMTFSIDSGVIL